jgi:hypothetical protein
MPATKLSLTSQGISRPFESVHSGDILPCERLFLEEQLGSLKGFGCQGASDRLRILDSVSATLL